MLVFLTLRLFVIYRVFHPALRHGLGWVDFDFYCYTVCPILLGLTGIWQKHLGS